MDRVIKKSVNKKLIVVIILLIISITVLKAFIVNYKPTYNIKKSEIITSLVMEKEISKTIMAVGTIEPLNNVLIECKVSGIITDVIASSGNYIEKDQTILKISNEELEIEYDQLLEELEKKQQQLKISINEFDTKFVDNSELILELDYKITVLKNSVEKNIQLLKSGRISEKYLEEIKNEEIFWLQKKVLTTDKWQRLTILQQSNQEYINLEIASINSKIKNLQRRINRLIIKAPYSGILNLENFSIGQNINNRQKLGVIDKQDGFKLITNIDEFYISSLNVGDLAKFNNIVLSLSFISPEVVGKKVRLEFNFIEDIPISIKAGQSFNIKIIQGVPEIKLVIESGSFIKESGGSWIYRVENNKAIKVPITLGIKNSEYYEVVSGLELGDLVIISNYKKFKEYEVITLED